MDTLTQAAETDVEGARHAPLPKVLLSLAFLMATGSLLASSRAWEEMDRYQAGRASSLELRRAGQLPERRYLDLHGPDADGIGTLPAYSAPRVWGAPVAGMPVRNEPAGDYLDLGRE